MNTAGLLLAALLALFPVTYPRYFARHGRWIAERVDAGRVHDGVPEGLLLAVAWHESRLGSDPRSGGSWGAPISTAHRGVAGTPRHTSSALARSYRKVGQSWLRAVHRFRCGLPNCEYMARGHHLIGYTPDQAMRLAARIYERAGIPLPPELERGGRGPAEIVASE